MRKFITGFLLAVLLLVAASPALALTQSEAKNAWVGAQQVRQDADAAYRQSQLDYKADPSPAGEQKVVDAAKKLMNSALDEAEAWLVWKRIESQNDSRVPAEIKSNISSDVASNLQKIEGLRTDVAGVETRAQALAVFLKMVGGYTELVTDVARNTGAMWAYIGDQLVTKAETFEAKLRVAAAGKDDLLKELDLVKSELELAKSKVAMAEASYLEVKLPGTPLVKFSEGNRYLREAQTNLRQAQGQMAEVFHSLAAN